MPAYMFIRTKVTDRDQYMKYVEVAREFWNSDEYAPVKKLREGAGEVNVILAGSFQPS